MNPKAAIVFFLMAATVLLVILAPDRSRADLARGRGADCTLGTCPPVLTPEDSGRMLTYSPGSEITLLADSPDMPQINCVPDGAAEISAFGNLQFPGTAFKVRALRRGSCLIKTGGFSAAMQILSFN